MIFLSGINALLIRVAILCSSVVIFPLLHCTSRVMGGGLTQWQVSQIYRASPHIGSLAAFLDRRGESKIGIISSMLGCLISFYFMYASSYFLWTDMVFPMILARGINDLYFFYFNLLEFSSLFFIRTRSSIKYLPKYISIMNLIYIMYLNSYPYSAQYESFWLLSHLTVLLFCIFLTLFETPAVSGVWNPFGTYSPSYTNPRCGYTYVPRGDFMLGFDIFTVFRPLHLREHFTPEDQLAYDTLSQQETLGIDFSPAERRAGVAAARQV